ncbi:hypothetical protein BDV32DRAFT_152679 [Aspergillus pseudonomiae]|uniref:Uncharacterized protein n=1 Tax=Aspergillus pseudonomiae TaxID=1506151 RepID=A0A5N7CUL7_9EURO|nr:uncharacterized protein BDV37DRAFT_289015 [Aspergillus pseudonomiae]KAB8257039.1 hypothetical protein BDV32DRAFT_152679 [Aspergillus pseudonomiae]KAE8397895.1 hypothetical protein BDV37DRAFT_289015 [Aspergillus pseudonomiae]
MHLKFASPELTWVMEDEQHGSPNHVQWLAYLKELGMLFGCWNHPEVWHSFCDSYSGMRDVLLQFDNWYTANRGPSDLVGEWKKFNQLELKRIVEKGKASAQYLKESRKPVPGFWGWWWTLKWQGAVYLFPGGLSVSVWHDQAGSDLREFAVASDGSWTGHSVSSSRSSSETCTSGCLPRRT